MTVNILDSLKKLTNEHPHSNRAKLLEIMVGPTRLSSSGHPFIAETTFNDFLETVPHLFVAGNDLLTWLGIVDTRVKVLPDQDLDSVISVSRSLKVLQNMVLTAAITAPADLWVLRQVLSTHKALGLLDYIIANSLVAVRALAVKFDLSPAYLQYDLRLLCSRGFVSLSNDGFVAPGRALSKQVLIDLAILPKEALEQDWYHLFVNWLSGSCSNSESVAVSEFLNRDCAAAFPIGWLPTIRDLDIGYRIVPLVLALHYCGVTESLRIGTRLADALPNHFSMLSKIFVQAGYCTDKLLITRLGARVFQKGSGPFGIIHAYRSYFVHHLELLKGKSASSWVARGENVAASQEANRETFKSANAALDRFSSNYNFHYNVFIEHAVGQGEATRQRFELRGEADIQYFGADLEDAAIDRAVALQSQHKLPANMVFVRNADIGVPARLIDAIRQHGSSTQGSVMLVGNGFHEVRGQTNEKMAAIFRAYCQAEILLLFTEESALSDTDLLATGWNTYHAGFRYVHDISGQGLRPALDFENGPNYSWKKCAELGGYQVLQDFTTRTRTIYPYPRDDGYNPSISVTYFCVPKSVCNKLGIFRES